MNPSEFIVLSLYVMRRAPLESSCTFLMGLVDTVCAVVIGAVVTGAVVTGAVVIGAVVTGAVVAGTVVTGSVVIASVVTVAVVAGSVVMGTVVAGAVVTAGAVVPLESAGSSAASQEMSVIATVSSRIINQRKCLSFTGTTSILCWVPMLF